MHHAVNHRWFVWGWVSARHNPTALICTMRLTTGDLCGVGGKAYFGPKYQSSSAVRWALSIGPKPFTLCLENWAQNSANQNLPLFRAIQLQSAPNSPNSIFQGPKSSSNFLGFKARSFEPVFRLIFNPKYFGLRNTFWTQNIEFGFFEAKISFMGRLN
jgi:hypothetical protein